jgi:exosortase/archaeosortase
MVRFLLLFLILKYNFLKSCIVFGVFALLIGLLLAAVVPLLFYLIRSDVLEFDTDMSMLLRIAPFISVILFVIALLFLLYAFVSILSGKRLLQYNNSGRVGSMVIGSLNLLNFPFGTIFCIASLYILSQPEVVQLYSN